MRRTPDSTLFPYTTLFRSCHCHLSTRGCNFAQIYRQIAGWATIPLLRRDPAASDYHVAAEDRKSTRLNSSHSQISYAVFCLKKKTVKDITGLPQRPHHQCA